MKTVHVVPPSGKTRGKVVKQQNHIVQGLYVTFFVLSLCFAAAGALAQQSNRERNQGGQGGQGSQGDQGGRGGQGGQGGNLESLDPGPRVGFGVSGNPAFPNNPGNPIQGLSPQQTAFFQNGLSQFIEVENVALPSPGNGGLGPTFNSNSCGSCHSQPAIGGTSPSTSAYPFVGPNPQVAVATLMGAANSLPSFVTPDGPVREARFKYFYTSPSDGRFSSFGRKSAGQLNTDDPDGSVHDLFTIAGRSDAPGCVYPQEDFARAQAEGNLALRIPTPVFGVGLIENISDATILANLASTAARRTALGIGGVPNRSGNDYTITRLGWKAQNKSGLVFAGEAYSVEVGITNEMFPNERGFGGVPPPASCLFNPTPEDTTIFVPNDGTDTSIVN